MKTLFLCFSQNLDYALGWMVIHSLWQAIAIALLMGVVMIVLRKKKAKTRYWVANIGLLMVLVSAIATFAHYYDFSKEPGEVRFIPEYAEIDNIGTTAAEIQNPKSEINTPLSILAFKTYFNEHIPLIVLVWAMGVALFILKLLGGISYCYYLRSRLNFPPDEYWMDVLEKLKEKVGVKQSIELVESALTRSPMVVGHIKPMILFPIGAINKLSPNDVEAILAHEIAHILRKDYVFNIIQSVIEALFYYHPAVWWISSVIRNERENCCDDVAIEICGSSVDYAKALVTIQEMAYYPMYFQPAMAFAGNRKNQLLHRVQRILNQPQNKTNVMEKLIATCTLVLVMIGLSFGENTFSKNLNNNTPSVSGSNEVEIIPETNENNTISNENQAFFLYFSDKRDSIKVSDDIPNGIYNYEDNTQTAQLKVRDHYVVSLKVNDIELTNEQMPNYKRLIDKILRVKAPSTTGASDFEPNGTVSTTSPTNGYSYSYSSNENNNVFPSRQGEWDGNTYSSQGSVRTHINKGIVTTYDENNHKWVIKPEQEGIKFIEHFDQNGKFLENIKLLNGKVYINDRLASEKEIRQRGWELSGQGIQRIGGFSNIQPSTNTIRGGSVSIQSDNTEGVTINTFGSTEDLKSYRISLKNKHKALIDKGLSLKRRGVDIMNQINPTLNDVGRDLNKEYTNFDDLKNTERKLEWAEIYIENHESRIDEEDNNQGNDLQSQIKELQSDIKELRQEIKECECVSNFDFRMGLIEELDRLFPVAKAQNANVFREFERRFLKIKNDWERGECDDFKYNQNINSSNLDTRVKSIARKAASLANQIDDCNCKEKDPNWVIWAKARLNAQESLAKANKNAYGLGVIENEISQIENQFNRLKNQRGNTDCYGCPAGNSSKDKSITSFQRNGNAYSYGTGNSYAEAENARKDAARKSKNKDKSYTEEAIHVFFQSLLDEGYISFNKQCAVSFNNNNLNIDGKRIAGSDFERIKQRFERALDKQRTFAINYTGRIQGSNNNLSITGSLSTSFN